MGISSRSLLEAGGIGVWAWDSVTGRASWSARTYRLVGCQPGRRGRQPIRRQPGIFARIRSFALNLPRAHGVANVSEATYTNTLSLDHLLAYGLPKAQN
jgi:hypothetical protein